MLETPPKATYHLILILALLVDTYFQQPIVIYSLTIWQPLKPSILQIESHSLPFGTFLSSVMVSIAFCGTIKFLVIEAQNINANINALSSNTSKVCCIHTFFPLNFYYHRHYSSTSLLLSAIIGTASKSSLLLKVSSHHGIPIYRMSPHCLWSFMAGCNIIFQLNFLSFSW